MHDCNLPSLKLSQQKNVGLQNVLCLIFPLQLMDQFLSIATSLDWWSHETNQTHQCLWQVLCHTYYSDKFWLLWRVSFPNENGHWCLHNKFVPLLTILEVQTAKALLVVPLNKKGFYTINVVSSKYVIKAFSREVGMGQNQKVLP